jgi:hypothetical protein
VNLPSHEISGFTSGGLLLAAGVVGFIHFVTLMAQIVLGFFSSYALSQGSHDLLVRLGAAHTTIGIVIPVVMIGAGVMNMLP